MKWAVLVALFALPLFAQPLVGPEVLSDPIPSLVSSSLAAPSVAIARDRNGVAIAWMAQSDAGVRISVAHLDAAGRIAGSPLTLPVASPLTVDAEYPSLAPLPGGSGFALAWIEAESRPFVWRAVYCRLDAALHASAPVALEPMHTTPLAPVIVRSGASTTWVEAGGWVSRLTASGATFPAYGSVNATDMTIVHDLPQLTGGESVTKTGFSTYAGFSIPFVEYTTRLDFNPSIESAPQSLSFRYISSARPAVANDGRDVLLVWLDGAQGSGGVVSGLRMSLQSYDYPNLNAVPLRLGTFTRDADATRPDIATDGAHFVIVWRNLSASGGLHDIAGAVLDADGSVTPLSIASTSADERDPSVVALGNGLFLVAYESDAGGERRVATRLVNLVSHRRAAR